MAQVDFKLRDYLGPHNRKPYNRLVPDLEEARAAGHTVYLWNVAEQLMLAGHSGDGLGERPWHDGKGCWYRTAKDCIDMRNGKSDDLMD
jgi:hypothetical protein